MHGLAIATTSERDRGLAYRSTAQTLAVLETLQDKAPVGFGFVDLDYRIVRLNEMLADFQGSTVQKQIGRLLPDVLPHLWPHLEPLYRHVIETGEALLDMEVTGRSPADRAAGRCWSVSYYPVSLHDSLIGVGMLVTDITERKRALSDQIEGLRTWRAAEKRFETSFEQAGIGAAILGLDGIAVRVNAAVCDLLGRDADLLVGRSWTDYNHPDDPPPGPFVTARLAAGYDTAADERRYVRPDGEIVWASTHLTLVRDEAKTPQYFLVQLQDITARKGMEEQLSHQALHDSLTGLANRTLLSDRLRHGLTLARRSGRSLGVIFIDVDHFKVVNDSLGHTFGDQLLTTAADRISETIRPGDTVARFGGDEFVIVCADITATGAIHVADRILAALTEPILIDGHVINVTASAGIALGDAKATPESLLRDSDTAMYRAKALGRGRIELFDAALRARSEQRLATSSALARALQRNEFTVFYQPIIDLESGLMINAEALLRWDHPERGRIGPDEFIPLAEESGLIVDIGAWVLEQACERVVQWRRTQPQMSVAVNLSIRQLISPGIVRQVEDVLERTGADPHSLCLEMTESVFMEDMDYFSLTMAQLRAMKIRLAIDDFGTGYSSLSYLQRFPVDAVKIDRAFIDGLGPDVSRSGLVAAIIAMASALDLHVVAEGVETQAQLNVLRELHCDRAQGYFLARPMPAEDLQQLVDGQYHWSDPSH